MSYLQELLGIDSHQVSTFFLEYLQNEVPEEVTQSETLYVAGMLAHYAQISRSDPNWMSPSGSLYNVLDTFVLPGLTAEGFSGLHDPEILEIAGSHTLFLVGFFRDQMNKRNSLRWYDHLGQSFFEKASYRTVENKKADLLGRIAVHFPMLVISCRNMSRTLRDERYLLKL